MTVVQALILGVVQGLTEFLPISSSGHLALFQSWFQISESTLTFDILLHTASLGAIIYFFWAEIRKLTPRDYWLLAVGTVPAVIFGLFIKDFLKTAFATPLMLGVQFLLNGGLNAIIHRRLQRASTSSVTLDEKKAFGIGIFQSVAIIPAISRSGSTLLGSLLFRLDKERAFTFTFLLAIPAILGASAFEAIELFSGQSALHFSLPVVAAGFGASLIASLWSLKLLKQFLTRSRFLWFAAYCTILGLTLLFFQVIR